MLHKSRSTRYISSSDNLTRWFHYIYACAIIMQLYCVSPRRAHHNSNNALELHLPVCLERARLQFVRKARRLAAFQENFFPDAHLDRTLIDSLIDRKLPYFWRNPRDDLGLDSIHDVKLYVRISHVYTSALVGSEKSWQPNRFALQRYHLRSKHWFFKILLGSGQNAFFAIWTRIFQILCSTLCC